MRMKIQRALSLIIAFCLLLTVIPILSRDALATTKITDSSKIKGCDYSAHYGSELDKIFQGKVSLFSNTNAKFALGQSLDNSKMYYVANGTISGYQCYIYAQAVYYYLFGDIPYHGAGLSGGKYWNNSSRVLKNKETISYEEFLDAGVGFGAYLRTTANSDGSYSSSYGHSLIILAYDSKNITYLEGNADGNGLVRITIKTWKEFNKDLLTDKGRKVSHIVQCNAPEAQRCVHSYEGCGVCKSCGYVFNWEDTFTKKDAGYYKVLNDFIPRSDKPYNDATKDTVTINEGEFVNVTGCVTNAFGNKWYKITYGMGKVGYVYSTYLEKNTFLDKCTIYPAYCTIKATAGTAAMTLPCSTGTNADSAVVESVSKGSTYTAVALVLNDQGNHWYQIETADGKTAYLPAGKMDYVESLTTDLSISGATAPTEHKQGKTFTISGKIQSTYNEITKVSAYVYKGTNTSGDPVTGGSDTVNGKSYSLKGSNVDSKVKFATLSPGTYTYAVYAHYKNYYADTEKTSVANTGKVCLYKATFTVTGATSCSHSYEGKVTTEATCTTDGVMTYSCKKCGATYTEVIEATGHSYGEWVEVKKPTTTENGLCERVCANCGDTQQKVLDKLDAPDPNAPQIVIESKTVACGQTITIKITAANMPSVKSLMIENFWFDSTALEFVSAEMHFKNAFISDWDNANMIATVAFAENTDINGVIMTLTFRVKDGADGDYAVHCDVYANRMEEDGVEEKVSPSVISAVITVASYERGDVNGDGYVNSDDAIYLLRYTLAPDHYPINQDGDVNGDGYVNSDDAIYLLRHTLSPERYPLN